MVVVVVVVVVVTLLWYIVVVPRLSPHANKLETLKRQMFKLIKTGPLCTWNGLTPLTI